jgi:hypothetical protein
MHIHSWHDPSESRQENSVDVGFNKVAYSHLGHEHKSIEKIRLMEETLFQLYCRIGICLRHHPHDLESYLKAWDYWKGITRQLGTK